MCPLRAVRLFFFFVSSARLTIPPCLSPVQQGVQEWKERISIRARPSLPTSLPTQPPATSPASVSLASLLCYPCHTTLTSRSARPAPAPWPADITSGGVVTLPVWTEARIAAAAATERSVPDARGGEVEGNGEVFRTTRMSQEAMKGVVGEFLLD